MLIKEVLCIMLVFVYGAYVSAMQEQQLIKRVRFQKAVTEIPRDNENQEIRKIMHAKELPRSILVHRNHQELYCDEHKEDYCGCVMCLSAIAFISLGCWGYCLSYLGLI